VEFRERLQNSNTATVTHAQVCPHTHTHTHTQIIFVSYFFHIMREHIIKVDDTRNIQFITGNSLCVGILSLIVTRANHRKWYYKSLLRRNGQGYKKCTKYIDNNFNPKDRRMENLFHCGMDTKYQCFGSSFQRRYSGEHVWYFQILKWYELQFVEVRWPLNSIMVNYTIQRQCNFNEL
jgi:hypothetical protein